MKRTAIIIFVALLTLCASCNLEPDVPEANVSGGTYDGPVSVTLSCSPRNCSIYYTLDGAEPHRGSAKYTGPISITYSCLLRFVALSRGGDSSTVVDELYAIKGPAGGLVFYDCDADNNATNNGAGPDNLRSSECEWRYLEASPEDIKVENTETFVFGDYRTSPGGSILYANGTTTYVEGTSSATDGKSTGTAIGTGKANTTKLVDVMGSAAYSGQTTTAAYAAKLCDDNTYGGYSDWFLPSKDELNMMYKNLKVRGLGGFGLDYYWSSSEYSGAACYAWHQFFINGIQNCQILRGSSYRVRAIRAFLPD